MNIQRSLSMLLCALALSASVAASPAGEAAISTLQTRWAQANYQLEGKAQKAAFEALVNEADRITAEQGGEAGVWIWSGIIKSTYAGVKGGLGALKSAKQAKADLEQAMALDANALDGSAYTSLGTLYFKVPGWPLGFGDSKKAARLLEKALTLNPSGIDPNYFYAEYLRDQGRDSLARDYYEKALRAPPRPGRVLADEGRRKEIQGALAQLN